MYHRTKLGAILQLLPHLCPETSGTLGNCASTCSILLFQLRNFTMVLAIAPSWRNARQCRRRAVASFSSEYHCIFRAILQNKSRDSQSCCLLFRPVPLHISRKSPKHFTRCFRFGPLELELPTWWGNPNAPPGAATGSPRVSPLFAHSEQLS